MERLDKCIALTLDVEGDWSNHPRDRGGKTKYGIIEATLHRANRLGVVERELIEELTVDEARLIYEIMYWKNVCADRLPAGLGALIFDIEVNHGAGGLALQQSLNYLIRIHGIGVPQLVADNKVGPRTLDTAAAYTISRDEGEFELMAEAYARRDRWWDNDPEDATFGMGWNRRGARVLIHAVRMALEAAL